MKYNIDKSNSKTAYLQLYEQLKNDIVAGLYAYKTKLPSKRTLAAETGISVVPVEHALELLCDEGYVEARERSGYFVIFRTDDGFIPVPNKRSIVKSPVRSTDDNIDFPFSVLAKTMKLPGNEDLLMGAMGDTNNPSISMYSDSISKQFETMTEDELIEWLYNLLFKERVQIELVTGEDYKPTIIYKPAEKDYTLLYAFGAYLLVAGAIGLIIYFNRKRLYN